MNISSEALETETAELPWTVKRLAPALGAEVTGIDLATLAGDDIPRLTQLLHKHMVLFFPGQFMSAEDQIGFGRHFGHLEGHPNLKERTPEEHPELFRLAASSGGIADEWHTDLTFLDRPSLMSILNMKTCPLAATPCGAICSPLMRGCHRPCGICATACRRCMTPILTAARTA